MRNILLLMMLSIFGISIFLSGCEDKDHTGREQYYKLEINGKKFEVPTVYLKNSQGYYSHEDWSKGGFSIDICIPNLEPVTKLSCFEKIGWGDQLFLYIAQWRGYDIDQYRKEVVLRGLNKGCWLELEEPEFSDRLLHFVDKRCGVSNHGHQDDWDDIYLEKDLNNSKFFSIRCDRKTMKNSPGCKVLAEFNGLRLMYSYGVDHVQEYDLIHQRVKSLISSFELKD